MAATQSQAPDPTTEETPAEPDDMKEPVVTYTLQPSCQILTGINSILFYTPVLFQSMGFGGNASLYSSAVTGAVLCSSTFISIAAVDKLGRRFLLISGGIQMITCQVVVAVILGVKFGDTQHLSKGFSVFLRPNL